MTTIVILHIQVGRSFAFHLKSGTLPKVIDSAHGHMTMTAVKAGDSMPTTILGQVEQTIHTQTGFILDYRRITQPQAMQLGMTKVVIKNG